MTTVRVSFEFLDDMSPGQLPELLERRGISMHHPVFMTEDHDSGMVVFRQPPKWRTHKWRLF